MTPEVAKQSLRGTFLGSIVKDMLGVNVMPIVSTTEKLAPGGLRSPGQAVLMQKLGPRHMELEKWLNHVLGLDPKIQGHFNDWTALKYERYNNVLRDVLEGRYPWQEAEVPVKALSDAIYGSKLPQNVMVYRTGRPINLQPGQQFPLDRFWSTSLHSEMIGENAFSPRPRGFYTIALPKNTSAMYLEPITDISGEAEVLVPPGSLFDVVAADPHLVKTGHGNSTEHTKYLLKLVRQKPLLSALLGLTGAGALAGYGGE